MITCATAVAATSFCRRNKNLKRYSGVRRLKNFTIFKPYKILEMLSSFKCIHNFYESLPANCSLELCQNKIQQMCIRMQNFCSRLADSVMVTSTQAKLSRANNRKLNKTNFLLQFLASPAMLSCSVCGEERTRD